jgi:hypothetical protein
MALTDTIARLESAVLATGGRLVLLSADESAPQLSADWRTVVDVTVHESEHALEHRPDRLDPLRVVVRLS